MEIIKLRRRYYNEEKGSCSRRSNARLLQRVQAYNHILYFNNLNFEKLKGDFFWVSFSTYFFLKNF